MRTGVLGLFLGLLLIGCGGAGDRRHTVTAMLTGPLTPSFGVSIDAYKPGGTTPDEECRDDHQATWCSTTHLSTEKGVSIWSNDESTDYDYYEFYLKNSDSLAGTIHLVVTTGGYTVVDQDVTLSAGQKLGIGWFDRNGNFHGWNGF